MAIPVSELQKLNPSSRIELFTIQLDSGLHGSNQIFRFHAGVNELNNDIVWQNNSYSKFPVKEQFWTRANELKIVISMEEDFLFYKEKSVV